MLCLLKKLIFPFFFGLIGLIILLGLGKWQVERLAWKNSIIAEISESVAKSPNVIMPHQIESVQQYQSVRVNGEFLSEELHVLHSLKSYGPGFKLIKPFKLSSDGVILVDLGFIRERNKLKERIILSNTITGNILFPNETDSFTPDPNFEKNIWFSRDLGAIANYLETIPVLIVLSNIVHEEIIATPLRPNLINNHLQYAFTWFSMAMAWSFMSIYWVMRIIKRYGQSGGRHAL
ncbi:MAG: SURF1 family protein [Paracoccaceae bacterium]|nr:SURF1 family protein [Paracoccaceae bacterium]